MFGLSFAVGNFIERVAFFVDASFRFRFRSNNGRVHVSDNKSVAYRMYATRQLYVIDCSLFSERFVLFTQLYNMGGHCVIITIQFLVSLKIYTFPIERYV